MVFAFSSCGDAQLRQTSEFRLYILKGFHAYRLFRQHNGRLGPSEVSMLNPLLCTPATLQRVGRAALIMGHPGHELKVFGWVCALKPYVSIVTDGSGSSGISRVHFSASLLAAAGAKAGDAFGMMSDAALYRAILEKQIPVFVNIVEVIARSLIREEIDFVMGDAYEDFNPTHDICRVAINAAVVLAQRARGKRIANYAIRLAEWENASEPSHDHRCLHLSLDDRMLREKLDAAMKYLPLRNDVEREINLRGKHYFKTECLREAWEPAAHDIGVGNLFTRLTARSVLPTPPTRQSSASGSMFFPLSRQYKNMRLKWM